MAVLLGALAWQFADPGLSAVAQDGVGPGGRIIVPRATGLFAILPALGTEQALIQTPDRTLVLDAGLSSDGQQAVYSQLTLPIAGDLGGSDLFLVPAAGGRSRPLALHDSPGASLTLPMFAADGRAVYYSATPHTTGPATTSAQPRIQRIATDGGAPTTVVESATSPAPAADGRMLAYLQVSNRGDALWLENADGSDGREVVPASRFLGLAYPRIAPDGRRIAFAATLDLPSVPTPGTPRAPFAWRPAREAHGLPWDVWLVNLDGSGLRRLTYLVEDDPSLAWSPDGRWLAIQGGLGLTLVDASSGRTERLWREHSFGAIDWARD